MPAPIYRFTDPKKELIAMGVRLPGDNTIRTESERLKDILGALMAKEYATRAVSTYGYPTRWVDGNKVRCECQRVSVIIGWDPAHSVPFCDTCGDYAFPTFPEDRSGPIEHAIPGMP